MTRALRFVLKSFECSRKAMGCRLANAAICVGLIVASFFCQGCLVLPVRAPTRTNGNSGAMEKFNVDFIQPGKTTREEVTAKLGARIRELKTSGTWPLGYLEVGTLMDGCG